ncbi:hypothetical protein IMZ48_25395 [Candidatus Bathyarchaeota archaeon]|nr:hypothetical protein [Candidatus Bathyarchaeota archaeon]
MLSQVANAHIPQDHGTRNSVMNRNSAMFGAPSSPMSTQAPPQLGALSFQGGDLPASGPGAQAHKRDSGAINPLLQNPSNSQGGSAPPLVAPTPVSLAQQQTPGVHMTKTPPPGGEAKRQFGISLQKLYERDNVVVPNVVYQCVQAVDLFGLNVEGIYRQSGSVNSVNKLKTMFDAGKSALLPLSLAFFRVVALARCRFCAPALGLPKPGELLPRHQQRHRPAEAVLPGPARPAPHGGAPQGLDRVSQ